MKHYELTYLIPGGISREEQQKLSERVIAYTQTQPMKQQGNSAWFSFDFYAESEKIGMIEEKLKDEASIKKYLILKKKVGWIKEMRKPKTVKPKVELEEIEKKLDEILNN